MNNCFLQLKQKLYLVQIKVFINHNIQLVFPFQSLKLRRLKYDLYIFCIYFNLSLQLIQTMLHTLILFTNLKWSNNLKLLNRLLNLKILMNAIFFILFLVEYKLLRLHWVIYFLNILHILSKQFIYFLKLNL